MHTEKYDKLVSSQSMARGPTRLTGSPLSLHVGISLNRHDATHIVITVTFTLTECPTNSVCWDMDFVLSYASNDQDSTHMEERGDQKRNIIEWVSMGCRFFNFVEPTTKDWEWFWTMVEEVRK